MKKRYTFRSFKEAKKFVQALGIKTEEEWRQWVKTDRRPVDIPSSPRTLYNEWKGWGDFVGTEKE